MNVLGFVTLRIFGFLGVHTENVFGFQSVKSGEIHPGSVIKQLAINVTI